VPSLERGQENNDGQEEQLLKEGDHHHHQQHQDEVGDVSCEISRHIRMPGSIIQASQGGTSPRTSNSIPVINYHEFEGLERDNLEEKDKEDATWVPGETDGHDQLLEEGDHHQHQ
jgi:hypothetical protein